MRMFVPNVLLLLAIATFTYAIPLSSQRSDESDADSSQDSAQSLSSQESGEEEVPISLKIDEVEDADLNLAAEYEDTNPTIVKREIPDPEKPCGCKSKPSSKSTEASDEDEHDGYLAYTNPNVRDRRHVSDDRSSEEAANVDNCDCVDDENVSSEEAEAHVPQSEEEQQDPILEQARRKRDVDAESALDDEDTASEEQSQVVNKVDSEEEAEAPVAEDIEDADLLKSLEVKDETAAARQKRHPDNYSLEDYAQGCEETEVNSYEANETTYKEDDKKRKRRGADSSQSHSDESKGSSSEEAKEAQKQNKSAKEAEAKN